MTWHKQDEVTDVSQEEVSVRCFFISVVSFSRWLKWNWLPAPLLPSPHQLCLIHSVFFFLCCHVESNNMKPHTLPPGGTSSSSTLCLLSLTHKHTPRPAPFSMAKDKCVSSLSLILSHTLFNFSKLWTPLPVLSSTCTLSFLPLWASAMLDFSGPWM